MTHFSSNNYLRSVPDKEGLIDLGSFLQLCGLLFLSMLIVVCRMKAEV